MRNKVIAALIAGGLLVGAGIITSVVSTPGTASAQEDGAGADEARGPFPRIFGFFQELLDDLVGEGTITQEQADAIVAAAEEKAAEQQEERQALRELIRGLLEDGVITEDEASELPDDHWLLSDVFDEAWEDGELTAEEIREIKPHPRRRAFRHGVRFGALLDDDGGIDQSEYDSLGDDHPLKQVDVSEYLDDGLITPEELREMFNDLRDSGSSENA